MRICPSCHLVGSSPLPLDMGYLLTATPAPTVLLGFLWPWMWGIASWPLATPCHHIMENWWRNSRNSGRLYFGGSKITAGGVCSHEIKRCLLLGRKVTTNLHSILKSRERYYFANKGPSSQGYGFSSSHVWMWELDYKESWVPKNWCFWTVVLENTLESPLDCKETQPVHPKGNHF